jgi:putative hemolysin
MNGYKLLLIAALMAVNAFFAAAEVALLSTRRSKLEAMAREGTLGAQAALSLLANPERLISLIQAAMAITTLGLGSAGEELIRHQIEMLFLPLAGKIPAVITQSVSFVLSFLVLTLTLVVVGEVVPKNIGVARADKIAVLAAPVLLLFYKIAEPFIFLIETVASRLSSWLGAKGHAHGAAHSAEELKYIVSSSRNEGHLTEFEENAVRRLLDLNEYVAREIMTPRHNITSIPIESSLDDVLKALTSSHHSRLPVWQERPENIVGIVHFRDLLDVWHHRRMATERRRAVPQFRLDAHLRKPLVVPETKLLNELIDEFRESHVHMAIVVDEFGTVSGLVTLEDALEQVFGEIEDEHDVRREPVWLDAPLVELEGATPIIDLEAHYGIEIATDGFETLAGFMLSRLGHIPGAGETVVDGDRRYTVLEMERNRIAKVRVERVVERAPLSPVPS